MQKRPVGHTYLHAQQNDGSVDEVRNKRNELKFMVSQNLRYDRLKIDRLDKKKKKKTRRRRPLVFILEIYTREPTNQPKEAVPQKKNKKRNYPS